MGYIQGEGRNQGTLFPVILDDFVPADHVCRVIDAFVEKLAKRTIPLSQRNALHSSVSISRRRRTGQWIFSSKSPISKSDTLSASSRTECWAVFIRAGEVPQESCGAFRINKRRKRTSFFALPGVQLDQMVTVINASLKRWRVLHLPLTAVYVTDKKAVFLGN